jgi:tRNA-splicing endonuclease subunit Sen54
MGHSVQRPSPSSSLPAGGSRKRLELLPEEALYLMEKGALFCWKASRDDAHDDASGKDVEWDSASQGAPMSVQQAYAEMIGREDLTLDRYQVCQLSLPLTCLTPLHPIQMAKKYHLI